MKITDNKHLLVNFNELNVGDVCYIHGFGIFMKMETQGTCNAVDLSNGELIECGDYCKVQVVDCELVIH